MRFFGYPYNDLVICKDSTDYLTTSKVFCLENNFGYIILVCE